MPSIPEHHDQSTHNIAFSGSFPQDIYADWAITTRFYAAAHLVRAWLLRFPDIVDAKIDSHYKVDLELTNKRFDRAIHVAYRDLLNLSKEARYECVPCATLATDVATAQRLYERIRNHVAPFLASHLPPPAPTPPTP